MKKILVIDDNHDLTNAIRSVLSSSGYCAITSNTPRQGINNG